MPYLIIRRDKDIPENERENLRKQHREHLKSAGKVLISAGASLSFNGKVIGGVIMLDTNDYEFAESFAKNDPFNKFSETTEIICFRQRWANGSFLGEN